MPDQNNQPSRDALGDRMKAYESRYEQRFLPLLPVIARLDGRCFHSLTHRLERPFDINFIRIMKAVASYGMDESDATCAYVQSDEISLIWQTYELKSQIFFGGRIQKMASVLAATASVWSAELFNNVFTFEYPNCQHPTFDGRVWQVPTEFEATNYLIWREADATRNSIQMVAQHHLGHSACQNLSCNQLQEALFQQHGINWNDYPGSFKRGTYLIRRPIEPLTWHQDGAPKRESILVNLPRLASLANREDVVLRGAEPIAKDPPP